MDNAKEQLEKIAYEQMCQQYGLKPEWLGKTFQEKGKTYTIVGLNIRSKRFPVVVSYDDVSTYVNPHTSKPETIKRRSAWNATYVIGLMTGDLAGAREVADAKRLTEERANWSMAKVFGLQPEWLDQTFNFRNSPVTIVGLAPTRRRFPVVGKNKWGQINYYPIATVLRSFTSSAAA